MRRVASKDPASVAELVARFQKPLVDLGCRMLRDRSEAEDLCQDVLVRAVQAASDFRATGSLRGWVFRMAANLASNRLRKHRVPLVAEPDQHRGEGGDPAASLEREERAAAVKEAVLSLPEKQRLAVILLRFEGLSYAEVAEALEVTLPAAVSIIHRAHLALRAKLGKFAK